MFVFHGKVEFGLGLVGERSRHDSIGLFHAMDVYGSEKP